MGNQADALKAVHRDISTYCADLSDEEWKTPSRADGWRVHDTVAHMSGSAKALFGPTVLKLISSKDIESTNDDLVDLRREWDSAKVLAEFNSWGRRAGTMAATVTRTPMAKVRLPLAELGRFSFGRILTEALVFDQHTHLHFDIAPALDRPAPAPDAERMTRVFGWMFAVLHNQLTSATPAWLTGSIALTLEGPGGGTWRIEPTGAVAVGGAAGTAAQISAQAIGFPDWGTGRSAWRDHDVTVAGDEALATGFLDHLNIV